MNAPPPPVSPGPPQWPITIAIPTTWTPEQAIAVFELLDNLRETVAALYLDQMQAHLRQEQGGEDTTLNRDADDDDDLTF